jgi:hypothetical protein
MSSTDLLLEAPSLLDTLQEVEPRLPKIGRAELAARLGALIGRLHEQLGAIEREKLCVYGMKLCRHLYANARSGDALPLGRAILFQSFLACDAGLERRASTVCGLLAADIGDVVEAVEHYVNALRRRGRLRSSRSVP